MKIVALIFYFTDTFDRISASLLFSLTNVSASSFATKFEHQKRALLNEHSLNYLSIIFVLSTVSISLFLFVAFFATINNVESTAKAK